MTTPKKGQEKPTSTPKTPGKKAEINRDKAELSDDELKNVTGGKRIIVVNS